MPEDGAFHICLLFARFSLEVDVVIKFTCVDRQCSFSWGLTIHCSSCSARNIQKQKKKRKVIINVCIIIITTAVVGWDCFEMPIAATLVL